MGNFAPSNRENELRVEKLYLLPSLAEKLDAGTISLEDYIGIFWQFSPERAKHARILLEDIIQAEREGMSYNQEDFAKFKKVCKSGNNRTAILEKLLHMGIIEKKNKTVQEYDITLSHKWIQRLEYLIRNWVMITK